MTWSLILFARSAQIKMTWSLIKYRKNFHLIWLWHLFDYEVMTLVTINTKLILPCDVTPFKQCVRFAGFQINALFESEDGGSMFLRNTGEP
jgi:hypothetical protein